MSNIRDYHMRWCKSKNIVAPRLANSSCAHSSNLLVSCFSAEKPHWYYLQVSRICETAFGCTRCYNVSIVEGRCFQFLVAPFRMRNRHDPKRITCNTFDGCRLHIESRCNPPASNVHPDRACPLICGWVAHPQTWRGTYRSFSRRRKAPVRSSADTVAASEVLALHQG